jgi:hypothetical protein
MPRGLGGVATDLARGTNARFTFDPAARATLPGRPGSQIIYAPAVAVPRISIGSRPAARWEQLIVHELRDDSARLVPRRQIPFVCARGKDTAADLWCSRYGKAAGDIKPVPYVVTPQGEGQARFSPDGQFVVYTSNESGARKLRAAVPTHQGGSG